MIDLHCHILPGVDDGPRDAAESLRMAELAWRDGILTIVATPHSQNGVFVNPRAHIIKHVANLNQIIEQEKIPITICSGAEVRIHHGMDGSLKEGKIASINNTGRYVLVEFPHDMILPGTREALFQLFINGITPILAHPERNTTLQRDPEVLAGLVDMGCLVQLTAMSITGELGRDAMVYAHLLLREGQAHVIASDAHDAETRPPVLSSALKEAARILGDMKAAEAMVTKIPRAILDGKHLSLSKPRKVLKKKSWWRRWLEPSYD